MQNLEKLRRLWTKGVVLFAEAEQNLKLPRFFGITLIGKLFSISLKRSQESLVRTSDLGILRSTLLSTLLSISSMTFSIVRSNL